jgi:solute carrier family 45 protein 1/2/4
MYKAVAGQQSALCWSDNVAHNSEADDEQDDGSESTTGSLMVLTCCNGGMQMIWLTIFAHGTAYLSSLDIADINISLIWALAPVCGAIIPPIVGVLSDRHRSSWGRRRPFMVCGAALVVVAMTALAWITPITDFICSLHGVPLMASSLVQYWAILWVVFLNVGIQTLQATSRALILDVCPSEQQALASAWVGRFTGVGNILGYILGSLPLPLLGEAWRFRWMAACAIMALSTTVALTVLSVTERTTLRAVCDYEYDEGQPTESRIARSFRSIMQGFTSMPPKAQRVCRVQFFGAMGWFAFQFYNTTFVSVLYLNYLGGDCMAVHPPAHRDSGMRFATTASMMFAILALGMNVVLPYIKRASPTTDFAKEGSWAQRLQHLRQTHILWSMGLGLYALLMFSTFFISSSAGGTITIAIAGLAWGINQYAPYTIIGEEIAAQQANQSLLVEQGGKGMVANQSGAMLGVHSVAVCVPQILAALLSSLIFWAMAKIGLEDAVGWVLRLSGVAGMVAAWLAWKLE